MGIFSLCHSLTKDLGDTAMAKDFFNQLIDDDYCKVHFQKFI